ncbi:porin family protein [Flavicella sp.]|uniref:porin family protein n=1 Tax=Flavicella sp. TaxID=2957742 RepID=UPI00260F7D10|nr:porin family protein [Flavicella sp.]MDG1804207.1 porin family protein [Flavicella sp.]
MKKLKVLFLLLLFSNAMHSQVLLSLIFGDKLNSEGLEFGLEGGVNWANISNLNNDGSVRNYNLGFYFDITLKERLHLDTGVLVKSTLGANNLSSEDLTFLEIPTESEPGSYKQELSYFIVPVLLKYSLKNRIYFEGGPQIGWMRKGFVEFNYDDGNEEIRIRHSNSDAINKIDAGITLGTGYRLMKNDGMTIGVKYYFGMVDVYKNRTGTKNNSLFLKLNVPIGANAAKKKREEKENKMNE